MNIIKHNQIAWDNKVKQGKRHTLPAGPETIKQAKAGNWRINLTPCIPVPREWFPPLQGLKILCLASGGGKQGPILAAAGADVTVYDISPLMLETDRSVAARDSLKIQTVEGDMADLSQFSNSSFDLIVHPVSNTFVPDVRIVWKETYRVLRKGGALLSGFTNPAVYLFDWELAKRTGELHVKYKLPYSDAADLDAAQKQKIIVDGEPMEFSHTLDAQIGGQIAAGFVITGFYEDKDELEALDQLGKYMATYIVTRAVKV
jgi:ubiquinone/menaquinone biosynthesis C-methylase UbiE